MTPEEKRAYDREYYHRVRKHKSEYREYVKSYSAEHKEQKAETYKQWCVNNKERNAELKQRWVDKNTDKIKDYQRKYHQGYYERVVKPKRRQLTQSK